MRKQQEGIKAPIIQGAFPESGYDLKFAAMSPTSAPFVITRSEWMRQYERTTSGWWWWIPNVWRNAREI